jgi:hypothetical protein
MLLIGSYLDGFLSLLLSEATNQMFFNTQSIKQPSNPNACLQHLRKSRPVDAVKKHRRFFDRGPRVNQERFEVCRYATGLYSASVAHRCLSRETSQPSMMFAMKTSLI